MGWIRSVVREVVGLFVEDGSFALAIVVWCALVVLGMRAVEDAAWTGPALFCGLGLILVESALRFARRGRR